MLPCFDRVLFWSRNGKKTVITADGLPWWVWGDGSRQTQLEQLQGDISAALCHSCAHGNALLHNTDRQKTRTGLALNWINDLKGQLISYCLTLFICGGPCHLASFKQYPGDLIFLWEQLVSYGKNKQLQNIVWISSPKLHNAPLSLI